MRYRHLARMGSAFNLCVVQNVPKSKKCVIVKLLKVLSSYNNALYDSSKLFLQQLINPGDMGPLDILRKV